MVAYNQDGRAEVTTRRWHNNEEAEPWVTPHVTANIPRHAHRSPPSVQTKPSLPPTLPPLLPERSPPRLSGLSPSATRGDFQPRLGAEQLQPYGPPPSVTPLQLQQLASIPFEGWAPTPHLQSGLVQQPFFPYLQAPAASILLLQQLPFVPFEGLAPPEQMFAFLQHSCHSADALHFPERLISCFTSLQLGLMPLCLPSMSDVFMAAPQSNHCYGSTLLENRPDQQSSAGSGRDSLQLPPNTTMMLGSVDGSGPGASSLSRGAIIDHHSSATIRITHQAAAHSQAHRGPAPPGADDAGKRREGANEIADGEHLIDTTVATFAPRERLANFWPQMLAETGTGDSNETRTGGTTYRPRRSRLFSNSSIKSHASILELHGGPSSCQATTLKIYGDKESTRGSSNCDKETKMSSQDFRSINAFAILALGDDSEIEKDSTTTKSAEKLVVDHTGSSSVAGRSQCCSSSERNSRNAMRQESAEAKSCRRAKKRHARGYLMKRPQKRKAKRQASHKEETTRQTKKNDEAGTKEQEQENDLTTRSRQGACPPCWAFCVASFSGLVPYSYGSPLSSTSVHFARMLDRNSSSAVALPSTSAQQKTWSSKMKKPVHQATAKSSCNTMTKSAPNLQCSANRSPPTEGHASSCSLHDVELVTNMGNYRVTKLSGALSQSGALLLHVRTTVFANVLRRIIATLAEFSRQHLLPVWTSVLALSNTAAAVIGALAFRGLAKSASAGSFVLRGSTVVDVSSRWTNQPQARFTAWRKQCESSVLAMGSAGLSRFALLLLLGLLVSCGMAARGGAHVGDQDQWWQAQKQFEDLTKSSTTLPATCNRVRGYGEWHSAWLRFTFPGDPILGSQNWAFSLVPADFTKTKADPLALSALRQAVGDEEGTTTPSDEAGQKPSRESEIALDVTTTFGEVAEWSKAFIRWTCNSLPERQILEFPLMPSKPLGGLKCPAPHVMKSECGPQTHLQREMSDEEWEETVESRYRQLLNVIQDPQELASELRLAPWAWGAWAFSKLAEKAALGNEVARPPIVWLRGYIAGGGGEPFKPPKWRIVVAQKRFETNLGEWVGEARRRPDRGDQVVNAMKSAAESVRNYHEMGKAHRMIHPENMLAHIVDENTRIAEFVLGNLMGIVEQAENRFGPLQGETTGPKCEDEDAMRRRWFDAIRGKKFWATVGRTYTYACKNYYSAYPSAVDFYFAMSGARNEEAGPLEYIDPAAVTRFNDPRVDTTRPKLSYVTYQQSDVWSVGVMILKMLKQFLTGGKYDKDAAKTIEAVDKALADELRASKVSVSEDVQESGGTTENDKEKQMLKEQMLKEWAKKSKCVTRWGDYGRNLRDRRHHSLLDDKLSAALGSTSQKSRGFFSGWKAEKASSEKGKALATFLRDGLLRYSLTCNQHSRDLTKLIDALETLAKAWGKADSDNQPRATAPAFLERSATAFDSEVVSAPAAPAPIDTEGAAAHPSPRFRASRARDFAFGAEEAAVSTGTTTSEQLTGRRDFLSAQHSQESTVHADEEALAVKAITNCC